MGENFIAGCTDFIVKEVGIYYRRKVPHGSVLRIQQFCEVIRGTGLSTQELQGYISGCWMKVSKIKSPGKRGAVSYFVAIIVSDDNFNEYLDGRKAKYDIKKQSGLEDDEEEDPGVIEYKGDTFTILKEEDERDIYFCKEAISFLIRDRTEIIPKVLTLKDYNENFPERRITLEAVSPLVEPLLQG